MSKGKAYYFKFDATLYLAATSKVQTLNYEEKGIFIELCAMLLMQNGRIKNDEVLHRQLRVSEKKLSNFISLLLKTKLLVSEGEYLSVKFISEAIDEMQKKSIILSENGQKGGRPKSKKKQTYKNENKNQQKKENISFESTRPPVGVDSKETDPPKVIPPGKKETVEQNPAKSINPPPGADDPDPKKDTFMRRAWLDSGKPLEEYEIRTATLPALSIDDMNCIMSFDPDPDKKFYFDLKRAKALLGEQRFSEELHMLKCRVQEGAAHNPRAYFNTLIKKAILDQP